MRNAWPARSCLRICMPTARSRVAASLPTAAFGRRSVTTSDDFRISLRSTSRASTAASTVSTAVPVKRSFIGGVPASLPISKLTSKRPLRWSTRAATGCIAPVLEASSFISRDVPIEGQAEIGGVAEPVAVLQRPGDLKFDLLAVQTARRARHRNHLDVAGIDADHLMRPQGVEHLLGRQRTGGAEIGRAIDRDLRRRARIVDDVADPHDVAGDGDAGAKRRDLR